jgi:hypothetical protein
MKKRALTSEQKAERLEFFLECLICANDVEAARYALRMIREWEGR